MMKNLLEKVNFFAYSMVGVVGIGMASEIVRENDLPDKIDDTIMLLLGVFALWYYKKNGEKWGSVMPGILIIIAAMLVKILAITIEFADAEAVGDDMGVLIVLTVALVYVLILAYKMGKKHSLFAMLRR